MITGTGSIRDRHFAGIYRNAGEAAASVAESPITPQKLSGTKWLKQWMVNSHTSTQETAKVIEELSKLTTDQAYNFLTKPLQDASPAREPFILALIRRLGPGGHDHTYDSAKANLSIITVICKKLKFTPAQLKKMMCFTSWEADHTKYESPMARLAKMAIYWGSHTFSQGASWLGVNKEQEDEIANEVLALMKKILN